MPVQAPAGVVASAFMFLYEKNSSFPGKLSHRLSSLPGLTVCRIGGLLNFMAEKNVTNGAVCPGINGQYPANHLQGGGSNYSSIISEVQNALQRVTMTANLTAAMQCVVGIQDSFLALGVDKLMGAGDATLRGASSVYRGLSTAKGYGDKGKTAADILKGLRDYIQSERGDPVHVFINVM
ncbi:hypothetical protein [Sphingomonas bacterium]|uniref:hypothetical protein n=1 Tax=Sphingomonas bacterium TaxID=1895847 RepID=UPI001575F237|nr:hypothetical protein [Sphingomonas bacterium]